jgi:hypothetical protein
MVTLSGSRGARRDLAPGSLLWRERPQSQSRGHPKATPVIPTTETEVETWMTLPWDEADSLSAGLVRVELTTDFATRVLTLMTFDGFTVSFAVTDEQFGSWRGLMRGSPI